MSSKRKIMSFGAAIDYRPPNPERTARRQIGAMGCDVEFREWTSRAALKACLQMQARGPKRNGQWHACVKFEVL